MFNKSPHRLVKLISSDDERHDMKMMMMAGSCPCRHGIVCRMRVNQLDISGGDSGGDGGNGLFQALQSEDF